MPWRNTSNPYFIWASEIILQQTRVDQGTDYYNRFIVAFPDVKSLANTSEEKVLKVWQGLGYYSRARNMHFAAKQVMRDFNGEMPRCSQDLLRLKGIGAYTAAAIASIAYGEKIPVADGNVRRVVARITADSSPDLNPAQVKRSLDFVRESIKAHYPGDVNQAFMELGATVCLPSRPDCNKCPIAPFCKAWREKIVNSCPGQRTKAKKTTLYYYYVFLDDGSNILFRKREENDIWKGLFEFPLINSEKELSTKQLREKLTGLGIAVSGKIEVIIRYDHVLSHRLIRAKLIKPAKKPTINSLPSGAFWVKLSEIKDFPVSRLVDKMLPHIGEL